MPHINIKHFPVELDDRRRLELISSLTEAISNAFKCSGDVISIALEPVEKDIWNEQVYVPEIVNRAHLLCKTPEY
jgi:phenylpyruvate tautomerase PptA (4-oxalocrotonate tautomerase family)